LSIKPQRNGRIIPEVKERMTDWKMNAEIVNKKSGFAKKVFHLHLRKFGDNNELYFRDYLNEHPEIAKEYEKLKLSLWKPFEHNRDGYTKGKNEFVQRITADTIRCYGRK
jgi:GrpB-like predicted nucleotidyltransferase (UPF0157 family)